MISTGSKAPYDATL